MKVKSILLLVALCISIAGCGPSPEEIQQAVESIAQGIESMPIEMKDLTDGLRGNRSAFAIESMEADVLVECDFELVNPNYMRNTILWTFTNYKATNSNYSIDGTVEMKINGDLNMSNYAGRAMLDLTLKGGPIEKISLTYKEDNSTGDITEFKVNRKLMESYNKVQISQRLAQAFSRVMVK